MKHWIFALATLVVGGATLGQVRAAPITMTCSDRGENYSVYFKPSSKTLILNVMEGYFDPQRVSQSYSVTGVSQVDGGYRVTASRGEAGPHIIVYTGNSKRVDYTESDFAFVFATDQCH